MFFAAWSPGSLFETAWTIEPTSFLGSTFGTANNDKDDRAKDERRGLWKMSTTHIISLVCLLRCGYYRTKSPLGRATCGDTYDVNYYLSKEVLYNLRCIVSYVVCPLSVPRSVGSNWGSQLLKMFILESFPF
jgi:hypothetical protein